MKRSLLLRRILLAVSAIAFGTLSVHAATTSWTTAGNWTTAGSWNGGVPSVLGTDDIFTTGVGSAMSINASPTVASWTDTNSGAGDWSALNLNGTGARSITITGLLSKSGTKKTFIRSRTTTDSLSMTIGSISVTGSSLTLGGAGNGGAVGQALTSLNVAGTTTVSGTSTTLLVYSTNATFGTVDLQTGGATPSTFSILEADAGAIGGVTVTGLTGAGMVIARGNMQASVAGTLTINGSGSTAFSGNLANYANNAGTAISTLALLKSGAGTQSLSGSTSSYAGGTTINGGVLSVNSLANGDLVTVSATQTATKNFVTVASTAGLAVGQTVLGYSTGTGGLITITGINLDGANTVRVSANSVTTATANMMFGTKNALGLATTAASGLVINGGTLQYTGATVSTDRLFTIGENGATLDASGTGALTFSNTGAAAFSGSGTRTLTLSGTNTGSNTLAASIGDGTGGATSLVKSGAAGSKWVLTGSSGYTGTTTVSAGTLLIAAGGGLSSSSAITVNGGATLDNANGGSLTGALTLQEGAALTTSASGSGFAPGSLTLAGNASDGWSPIALTNTAGGGLVKSGTLTLTISGLSATTYNLTSGSGFSGAFNSPGSINGFTLTTADSGATFTGSGGGFNYTYTNLDNTLGVSAIPEPSTWALLAITGTFLMVMRRRRQV